MFPSSKEGEGIRREALILNFGRYEGRFSEGGAYLRGGTNSRIYGTPNLLFRDEM